MSMAYLCEKDEKFFIYDDGDNHVEIPKAAWDALVAEGLPVKENQ